MPTIVSYRTLGVARSLAGVGVIDLRCQANRKFAEFDPASARIIVRCRTCSANGTDVFHEWALADLLDAADRPHIERLLPSDHGKINTVNRGDAENIPRRGT